jgi:hypothetical protein
MKRSTNWLIAFAGAMVMAWLGNFFYDQTKSIPVLNYITSALNWLYDTGFAVLTYKIQIWVVLISIATVIGLLALYAKLLRPKAPVEPSKPEFTKYKKDVFKNWTWRWDWKYNVANGWVITNLTPFCPNDDVQLLGSNSFFDSSWYCPKCDKQYNRFSDPVEYHGDTEVLILDKVNKKTYLKD